MLKCSESNLNIFIFFSEAVGLPNLNQKAQELTLLQKKRLEYSPSFSIHGLSRIFHGTNHERLFWLVNLIFCFGLSAFLVRGQVKSYFDKAVYIEEKIVSRSSTEFPVITICDNVKAKKYDYCGDDASALIPPSLGYPRCQIPENVHNYMAYGYPGGLTFEKTNFKINCGNNCLFQDLLHWGTVANFSDCVQFNKAGKATSSTDRINFSLSWNKNKRQDFKLYVHEKDAAPYAIDFGAFQLSHQQDMDIRIQTTKVNRLQSPNCVNEEAGQKLNIFPGIYTVNACAESIRCLNTFKECGDSFDFCQPFIPEDIRIKYFNKNLSIRNVSDCLRSHIKHNFVAQCRPPCNEVYYEIINHYQDLFLHWGTLNQ